MIIDCHTHIGRNSHINASVDQLLKSMDEAGVDKSLVIAGKLNDASNEWMLEEIAPHKDRLLAIVAAHPQRFEGFTPGGLSIDLEKEEIKQITDWYGEGKIVGAKFYVGYYHYYPSEAELYLSALDKIGCPALFHCGDCLNSVKCAKLKYAHPLQIDDVAVDYPNMNFIIAHMGYPWVRDSAEVCYKNDNVYSDMSGFVYGDFDGASVRKFSNSINSFLDIANNDKLLFGSDWPISNQKSYVDSVNQLMSESLCPAPEFLSKNTMKAFKL
jgi:predicted TIM-barrel fold metal-dependent hydrolase